VENELPRLARRGFRLWSGQCMCCAAHGTVAALDPFDLKVIAPAHCTGWRVVNAMHSAFGDALVPAAVGKTYRF